MSPTDLPRPRLHPAAASFTDGDDLTPEEFERQPSRGPTAQPGRRHLTLACGDPSGGSASGRPFFHPG